MRASGPAPCGPAAHISCDVVNRSYGWFRRSPRQPWSTPTRVTPVGEQAGQARVGIDRHMRAIAVWGATRGGKSRIEASELTVTKGVWSPPAELAEASQMLLVPQIAVNARGDAVAAWKRWRGGAPLSPGGVRDPIAAAVKPSGRRSWLAPVTLGTEFEPPLQDVAAFEFSGPHVAIDARGDAAVVWQGRYGRTIVPEASAMDAGGRWQRPTPIATTFALYPHVAMDRNGDATSVWQGPRGSVVAASKPRMAGGWSTQQTIYHGNPTSLPTRRSRSALAEKRSQPGAAVRSKPPSARARTLPGSIRRGLASAGCLRWRSLRGGIRSWCGSDRPTILGASSFRQPATAHPGRGRGQDKRTQREDEERRINLKERQLSPQYSRRCQPLAGEKWSTIRCA